MCRVTGFSSLFNINLYSSCLYALIFYDIFLYYKLWLSLLGFRSLFLCSTEIDLKLDFNYADNIWPKTEFWHIPIHNRVLHDQKAGSGSFEFGAFLKLDQ